jgi:putative RNA 2'-phosphotransferase
MDKKLIKISKFLCFILRHKPESINLTLDRQGWAEVDELINLACQKGTKIDFSMLEKIVANDAKQRFSFSQDKSKIRANQGHSIQVDLSLKPQTPPEYLFHGTATRFIKSISKQGLLKKSRQYVHLSANKSTAISVGKRYGTPVLLRIRAKKMQEIGYSFFLSDNGVWLTDRVPREFIDFSDR